MLQVLLTQGPRCARAWKPCLNFSSFASSLSSELQKAITQDVAQCLLRQKFAVIDNAFSCSDVLRREIQNLPPKLFIKNHTHLVRPSKESHPGDQSLLLLEKSAVFEADLKDPHVRQASRLFADIQTDRTLATLLSLYSNKMTLTSQAVKLQRNEGGGGCFPMHFDSDPRLDQRLVTAIFYLNADWKRGDGGELRLYPFPFRRHIDIAPVAGRMVLFHSTDMLHRVLPSTKERFCFTIWLSGGGSSRSVRGKPSGHSSMEAEFLDPAVLRHALRVVYADEWEASLRQSHPEGEGLREALEVNRRELVLIRRALGKYAGLLDDAVEWARKGRDGEGGESWTPPTRRSVPL